VSAAAGLLTFLGMLVAPIAAQDLATADLLAAWTWEAASEIEWFAGVGGPRPRAILVADRGGAVNLRHLITSNSRLGEPLAMQPGVAFAGEYADRAYLFDSQRVIALTLTDTAESDRPLDAVAWSIAAAAVKADADEDPEHTARIVAGAATAHGVLLARSDGRVAELAARDGATRWSAEIAAGSDVRLLADGRRCAVLWRYQGRVQACLLETPATLDVSPALPGRELGAAWPLWQEITADGLLAAWSGKLALLPAAGELRKLRCGPEGTTASAIGVYRPERVTDAEGRVATGPPLLIAASRRGGLAACDFRGDKVEWSAKSSSVWSNAAVVGDAIVAFNDSGAATLYDAASGARVAEFVGDPASVKAASATTRNFFAARVRGATLMLERTPRTRAADWNADAARKAQRAWRLMPTAGVREVRFLPGRLVVATRRELHVFVLPEQ
jgi:hypothetical protein